MKDLRRVGVDFNDFKECGVAPDPARKPENPGPGPVLKGVVHI
jgi:hypothetical protein